VKHVVSDLLQELAGEELGVDRLRRQQGWELERAQVQAWWDKAKKVGEEAYFLDRVLPSDAKARWPKSLMLRIISKKYPQHLPALYKTVLNERPQVYGRPLAEAVAASPLSDSNKRELFLEASRHENLEHRRVGLRHLQKHDPEQFHAILLATLEALPKTPTEPYWRCPEAGFAQLVALTDDARAWKMLEKVIRRSDVGLRMEFLNCLHTGYTGEVHKQQRLDLLAKFLNDNEAPDWTHRVMFEGPHAGFRFKRLEVRDLAAMTIASILKMPDSPDENWTPEQWRKLRDQVKGRLKK